MLYAQFELWDHISKLTQSAIEHRRRAASVNDKYFAEHIKRLQRAYLVSFILFIKNSECSHPFHVVFSNIVKSCGESTELMIILNRFGTVASTETQTYHPFSV